MRKQAFTILAVFAIMIFSCKTDTQQTFDSVSTIAPLEGLPKNKAGETVRKAIDFIGGWETWENKKTFSFYKNKIISCKRGGTMNVLIIADMEGASGIDKSNADWTHCGSQPWENYGRKAITDDIKQIVSHCMKLGAQRITILDSHDKGNSILREEFEGIHWLSMIFDVEKINDTYDYAILAGFHSKTRLNGILAHTFRPDIESVEINDNDIGEIGALIYLLCEKGVPPVLITGDYHCILEAQDLLPSIEGVEVKRKLDNETRFYSREEIDQQLQIKLKTALQGIDSFNPIEVKSPLKAKVTLNIEDYISDLKARDLGDMFQIEGMSLVWTCDTIEQFWSKFIYLIKILIMESTILKKKNAIFINTLVDKFKELAQNDNYIKEVLYDLSTPYNLQVFTQSHRNQIEKKINDYLFAKNA